MFDILQAAEAALTIEKAKLVQQEVGQCAQTKALAVAKTEIQELSRQVASLKLENEQLRSPQPQHVVEGSVAQCEQIAKLELANSQLLTELQNTHTAAEKGLKEAVRWQEAAEVRCSTTSVVNSSLSMASFFSSRISRQIFS